MSASRVAFCLLVFSLGLPCKVSARAGEGSADPDEIVVQDAALDDEPRILVAVKAAFPGSEVSAKAEGFQVKLADGKAETVKAGGRAFDLSDGSRLEAFTLCMTLRLKQLAEEHAKGTYKKPKDTLILIIAYTPKGSKTSWLMRSYGMMMGEVHVEPLSLLGDGRHQAAIEYRNVVQTGPEAVSGEAQLEIVALPDGKTIFESPLFKETPGQEPLPYEFAYAKAQGSRELEIRRATAEDGDREYDVFVYRGGAYSSAGRRRNEAAVAQFQSVAAWAASEGKMMDEALRWPGPEKVAETPKEWLGKPVKIETELTTEERLRLAKIAYPNAAVREVPMTNLGQIATFTALVSEWSSKRKPDAKALFEISCRNAQTCSVFLVVERRVTLQEGKTVLVGAFQAHGTDTSSTSALIKAAEKKAIGRPLCIAWLLLRTGEEKSHRMQMGDAASLGSLDISCPQNSFDILSLPSGDICFGVYSMETMHLANKDFSASMFKKWINIVRAYDETFLLRVPLHVAVRLGEDRANAPWPRAAAFSGENKGDAARVVLQGIPSGRAPVTTYSYVFRDGAYRFEKEAAPEPEPARRSDPGNMSVELDMAFVDSKGAKVPNVEVKLEIETRSMSILDPWAGHKSQEQTTRAIADRNGRFSWKGKAHSLFVVFSAPGFDDGAITLEATAVPKETIEVVLWREEDHKNIEIIIAELKHKSALRRLVAAEKLGALGDPRAVPALLEALKDDDRGVLGEAIKALGRIGDERAVEPLKGFQNDKRSEIEVYANSALRAIARAAERRKPAPETKVPVPEPGSEAE